MSAAAEPTGGTVADGGDRWRYFWLAVAMAVVYSAVHIAARLLASPNLGEDDPLTNVYIQELASGYSLGQPPLFEWVMWLTQRVGGPTLLGFQLVKYAFLIGTIAAIYLATFEITRDGVWSVITAEALTLIYHVGWRFHEGFTGIIPAMFFAALSLYILLRLIALGRTRDFVLLGLVFGLGLLSAHNFAIAILSFLTAAAIEREVRPKVFRWPLLLSLAVAVATVAPYYLWALREADGWTALGGVQTIFTNDSSYHTFWRVLRKAAGAPFGFFWSLLIFLLLASLPTVRDHFRVRIFPRINWHGRPIHRFLAIYTCAAFVLLFLSGVAFSYVRYANHDLLSFLPPALVLLFVLIYLGEPTAAQMRRWAIISFAIIAFAFVARAANMFVLDPVCKICRWGVPYTDLAETLVQQGFTPTGAILAFESELAGNLRLRIPEAKIVMGRRNGIEALLKRAGQRRPVAIVWQVGGKIGLREPRASMIRHLAEAGITSPVVTYKAPWHHVYKRTGYRHTEWNYALLRE
ncbi:MAG: glycosyltransferase family 39 protein [Hyphomicrobiaceae bacterium]